MKFFTLLLVTLAIFAGTLTAQVSFVANSACYGELTAMADASPFADTAVAQWSWDFDDDGAYDDALGKTANHIFDAVGLVPVGLKISFNDGSADSSYQDVLINPLPQVNFYVDNLCEDDTAVFTDNSSISLGSIVNYYWDFNDDGSADEVGQVVQYNHGVAGLYVTTLQAVSDAGCSSSTSKQNEVFSNPISDFSAASSSNVGTPINFVNTSTIVIGSIDLYLWNFGDGEGSSIEAPSHEFKTAQGFTVQLVTISDQDCRDTMVKEITIDEALAATEAFGVESTVITPNGDAVNDFLKINALDDYASCKVTIYNSLNEVVFETESYSNDEGGGFAAQGEDAGAYYYIIECGAEEPLMGVVNVLK